MHFFVLYEFKFSQFRVGLLFLTNNAILMKSVIKLIFNRRQTYDEEKKLAP